MNLEFTGEFFIPGKTSKRIEADHMERYKFALNYIKNKSVLDIACGVGYGSNILATSGAQQVVGVDISNDAINYARENYNNIKFQQGNLCDFNPNELFDVIVSFETIEHMDSYQDAISNYYKLLKDDGILIISSPNRIITSPDINSVYDKPGNKYHQHEFLINELKSELQKAGFLIDNSDIYGQRFQRYFKNRYIRRLYQKIFNPDVNSSPIVTKVKNLIPRYFIMIAKK